MKIRIGQLTILWGDPVDVLTKEFDARVKYNALMKNLKAALKKLEDEENEPQYIKEVKAYIKGGHIIEAVKHYKLGSGKNLVESRDEVYIIRDKMELEDKILINAKNK